MRTIDPDLLAAALAEALETMAFIGVEPPSDPPPAEALNVTLAFFGPISGQLSLRAPAALGTTIAANLSAVDAASVAPAQAADALRELTNVTAGLLLRQVCTTAEMPQLAIPVVSAAQADAALHDACSATLCADGHPITVSIRTHA